MVLFGGCILLDMCYLTDQITSLTSCNFLNFTFKYLSWNELNSYENSNRPLALNFMVYQRDFVVPLCKIICINPDAERIERTFF
jgi:hypothetical protein